MNIWSNSSLHPIFLNFIKNIMENTINPCDKYIGKFLPEKSIPQILTITGIKTKINLINIDIIIYKILTNIFEVVFLLIFSTIVSKICFSPQFNLKITIIGYFINLFNSSYFFAFSYLNFLSC